MSNALIATNFTEAQSNQISTAKNEISFSYDSTLSYGSQVTKTLTTFSNDLLQKTKLRDNTEIEGYIMELMGGISEIDPSTLLKKQPGFSFAKN